MTDNGRYTVEDLLTAREKALQKTNADLQGLDVEIKGLTKTLHKANQRLFELEVENIMGKGATRKAIDQQRAKVKKLEDERAPLQERWDRGQEIRREVLARVDETIIPQFKPLIDPLTHDLAKKVKAVSKKFEALYSDFAEIAALQEVRSNLFIAHKGANKSGAFHGFERDPDLEKIIQFSQTVHLPFAQYVNNFVNALAARGGGGLYGTQINELVHPTGFKARSSLPGEAGLTRRKKAQKEKAAADVVTF